MLVPPESSSAVLVMISSKSVSICNRFHARRVNSGKITISLMPSFDGNLHEIWSQIHVIRDSTSSCGEKSESLSHLGLLRYQVVTDRRTDGQTELR